MPVIDTIAGVATIGAGPVFTALTMAAGDSATLRDFPSTTSAYMFDAAFSSASSHKGQLRVRSPRLHDSTTGLIIASAETPDTDMWPDGALQPLYAGDALTIELNGTAADVDGAALMVYYAQAGGLSARLFDWPTIMPLIKNLKPFVTAITNSGTAGTWTDTVITTTDNQLHADADYAILGLTTDTAMLAMGVKGQDTGNLRPSCPATTTSLATANYFMRNSKNTNLPMIPVVAANNRGSLYVSTIDRSASSTANVTLWCAELTQKLPAAA